jgi:thimet oligopeptidase
MLGVAERRSIALVLVLGVTAGVTAAVSKQQPAPAASPANAVDVPFTRGILDTPDSLTRAVDGRLARARSLLERMLAATGPRTVANTLAPYDEMWGELFTAASTAQVVAALHPEEAMRKAGDALNRKAGAAAAEVPLRPDVYRALARIELKGADAPTRFYVERELKEFRRAGVDRPAATRERIRQLQDVLTQSMDEFQRNIRNGSRRVVVASARELEGLPADFIERHKADAAGAYSFSTNTVDAAPVLTYARDERLRRRMLVAVQNVAAPENMPVLSRILEARYELARLLGFPNWASYDTASRMAGDFKTASEFIDRIVAASGAKVLRERDELIARKHLDAPGTPLNWWDRYYYGELVRRASYSFDSQAVRPYLPFDRVLAGVLDVTGTIFGVRYDLVSDVPVWHPSVRVYEMRDGGKLLGRLYLDLHPRPGKAAGGASLSPIRHGSATGPVPEVVLAASLPGGQPGDPGLMTHDEVRTLFHEFGHVVHRVSGGHQPWQRLSSIAIERDFSEAPSQMLEEWVWDPRVLASFGRHYQTGEPIPAALIQQMRRASEFGKAIEIRGQMVLARVALSAHVRRPSEVNFERLWVETERQYMVYPHVPDTHREASFPHIGQAGYASAYYSYMWSLVIAKDLFGTFEGRDLTASGVARRYRDTLFASGSTKPAAQLVRDFLGRPFSPDAWARWLQN